MAAAIRGPLTAWAKDNPSPMTSFAKPPELWESINAPAAGAVDAEPDRYLRQIEYNLRPNTAARFERDVAEAFDLVRAEMPEVRACVLYRSAGIPLRYRVVFRMMESKPLPPKVAAWVTAHPYTEYTDGRWDNELYIRTV